MLGMPSTLKKINFSTGKHFRLRLTNKCNAKCNFCHGEGRSLSGDKVFIEPSILETILKSSAFKGDSIAITGGEPLLHPALSKIIDIATEVDPNCHLNSNGILLREKLSLLSRSSLKYLHINLATLSQQLYKDIYGIKRPDSLLDSLLEAYACGIAITINCVVLPGINDSPQHLINLIEFCTQSNFTLSFIEFYSHNKCSDGIVFQRSYEEFLTQHGYSPLKSLPGRIIYGKDTPLIMVAAPCAPAKAWNGSAEYDAYVVMENGSIRRFCE